MLVHLLLAFQLVPMPNDPVRAAEVQQRALIESAKQHERDLRAREDFQKRQFELKFNKLVEAVASFAKEYNGGKGHKWPLHEVERLRKAMGELQAMEKSLRAEQSTSKGATTSACTLVPITPPAARDK